MRKNEEKKKKIGSYRSMKEIFITAESLRLAGMSASTPRLKARSTSAGCSGLCPVRFLKHSGMETPQPVWANWSCGQLPLQQNKCFLTFNYFVPTGSFPFIEHPWEESRPVLPLMEGSFIALHQAFMHIDKIPLSIVFSRQNSLSSVSFPSYKRCSNPPNIFVTLHWTQFSMPNCLILGSP